MTPKEILAKELQDHQDMMEKIKKNHLGWVEETGSLILDCLKKGNKILVAGNGGSAADAQHFSAELIGRFSSERKSIPALALTTDTSALSAIANDYGFRYVFSRQLEGLGRPGDLFIGISTSGNSENLIQALKSAESHQMKTIALLGKKGGDMKDWAQSSLVVPSMITQRIQEAHEWVLHAWCALIDASLKQG